MQNLMCRRSYVGGISYCKGWRNSHIPPITKHLCNHQELLNSPNPWPTILVTPIGRFEEPPGISTGLKHFRFKSGQRHKHKVICLHLPTGTYVGWGSRYPQNNWGTHVLYRTPSSSIFSFYYFFWNWHDTRILSSIPVVQLSGT